MPTTTLGLFDSVDQTETSGREWSLPLEDVLVIPGNSRCEVTAPGSGSWILNLLGPKVASEIPDVGIIVTNIFIRINTDRDTGAGIVMYPENIQIAGGLQKNNTTDVGTTPIDRDFDGDLAYWGITNTEAVDFIRSLETLNIEAGMSAGANDGLYVYYVQCRITYELDPTIGVNLPTIF